MHRIADLALDRVIPFDLGIPARVFGAAHDAAGAPLYDVTTCSLTGGTVRTSGDYAIVVDHDAGALAAADTVVIATQQPGGRRLLERSDLPVESIAHESGFGAPPRCASTSRWRSESRRPPTGARSGPPRSSRSPPSGRVAARARR